MKLPGGIRCFFIMMICFAPIRQLAAQGDDRISCVSLVRKDTIILRWVPASIPVWQSGINHGYIIKRYTIARDGQFIADALSNGKILTTSPVRPAGTGYFDKLAASDSRAAVVEEAIYNAEPLSPDENFGSFIRKFEDTEVRLGFALFMCDLSQKIAEAAGLLFTDTHISAGERYVYSVSLVNTPEGISVEPAVLVVDAGEITLLPQVEDIQAVFLDRAVKFRWPLTIYKGVYTAFIIEKSADGKNYNAVSELPLVNFSEEENPGYFIFTDSLSANDKQYYYRIKGISPFGITGPVSKVISGKGIPEFSAYASIDTAFVTERNTIEVRWRISESASTRLVSINILKSENYNGPFEQINRRTLDQKARLFTDDNPVQSNYYQVMLEGENNLKSYSFPYFVQTEDNSPPDAPEDLSGDVDSTGKVSIVWRSNDEPDLMGYKVFRANSPAEDFISLDRQITGDNFCSDSINLNTLSQKIYYRVVAIDRNYNNSDYSQILELSRPDTIAPAPAIIKRIDNSGGNLLISFEASPSDDISSYELHRKAENDTTYVNVRSWNERLPENISDVPLSPGITEYMLITVDKNGNKSENRYKTNAPGVEGKVIILAADQSPDGHMITLSWKIPEGFIPLKTTVYRSKGDDPINIYATIENNLESFEDLNTEINTIYNYRIILFGERSALGSEKLVFNPSSKNKRK